MGKQAKAEKKEAAIKERARRIAEAVLRQRLREEALDETEKEDILKTVYNDQLERLRRENS